MYILNGYLKFIIDSKNLRQNTEFPFLESITQENKNVEGSRMFARLFFNYYFFLDREYLKQ